MSAPSPAQPHPSAHDPAAIDVAGPAGKLAGLTFGSPGAGGTPVLLIHPINLRGRCWAHVAGGLEPRYCIAPDMRGHGGSTPRGPFGLEEWAADCVAVLDALGIERVHAVGGSLGGTIAVYLAATLPDRIASVTAIGSTLAVEGADLESVLSILREHGVTGMFREVIPKISVAPGTPDEVIEEILSLANPNDVETVAAIWAAVISTDARHLAGAVRCPVEVVTGELDLTCPRDQAEEMARLLGARLVVLPGVGHLPMLERPQALVDELSRHLAVE
jgi:pimeloyl-ACP methyl ester carboxylesterase